MAGTEIGPAGDNRVLQLAEQIATFELLRLIIGEMAFDEDPRRFHARLVAIETAVVAAIESREHFPERADEATETYVREAASGYITRLLASIRHPTDPPPEGSPP